MAGAIIGIGYGSITPVFQTQIINSVEPHRVGIANSLYFNSMDMGMAIGTYIFGIVAGIYGFSSIYLIGIALIVAASLEYIIFTHKKEAMPVQSEI